MWLTDLRRRSLAARGGVLVAALAAPCVLLAAPIGYFHSGMTGILAAVTAAALCLAGAGAALVVNEPFRGTDRALKGLLWGMIFRMGIPLGLGLAVQLTGTALAGAGFLLYLLVFFELALAVEVYLSLPAPKSEQGETK
ncbi:MAG: hypothetical protein JW818_13705 [Pirellulales bacterium]|nr:hypothetical protein [Pirellulales bacterium]